MWHSIEEIEHKVPPWCWCCAHLLHPAVLRPAVLHPAAACKQCCTKLLPSATRGICRVLHSTRLSPEVGSVGVL